MSPKTLIGVCFVHNVNNRNMLRNDIKGIKGSSKELAEIASGSVIITIYVIQIPSEGSKLAEKAYNQNLYFKDTIGNRSIFGPATCQRSSESPFQQVHSKNKKIPLSYQRLNGIFRFIRLQCRLGFFHSGSLLKLEYFLRSLFRERIPLRCNFHSYMNLLLARLACPCH